MEFPTREQVAEIAKHLTEKTGDSWTLQPRSEDDRFDRRARIVRSDGAYLSVYKEWNSKNKVSIYGGLSEPSPDGYSNSRNAPSSIGASIEKGGERIAMDIVRRYLPSFDTWVSEERGRRSDHVRERKEMHRFAGRLARALRTPVPAEEWRGTYRIEGSGVRAEITYSGRVDFEFGAEGDEAIAIAEGLRQLLRKK